MVKPFNPAWHAFLAQIGDEWVWAQVVIRASGGRYELRHVNDRARPDTELRLVPLQELRSLAQFTAQGAFRPLKSAPNLQTGWRSVARDAAELEAAVRHLYPGSIADWHAARSSRPPVTNYREFTERQSGMYRITAKLTNAQAALVIRACCHEAFCLKRRLWTVESLEAEEPEKKSAIPCLEPCAILLEFARKAMRLEQEEKTNLPLGAGEAATMAAALEVALARANGNSREADFNAPENPRRLRLLLEKIRARSCAMPEPDIE